MDSANQVSRPYKISMAFSPTVYPRILDTSQIFGVAGWALSNDKEPICGAAEAKCHVMIGNHTQVTGKVHSYGKLTPLPLFRTSTTERYT